MNILLTGASGLIGSALLKDLVAKGHQVTGLSRNPDKAQLTIGKFYGKTLLSKVNWCKSLEQFEDLNEFEAVINLAGEPIVASRWTPAQKQRLENSRWLMTKQLVDLINKSKTAPSVFISGSAIGYYGRQDDTPIAETFTAVHPEFSHQLCQRWEQIALQAGSSKTRVCLLRTGIVLSNKGGALAKMLLPFKLGLGGPIGNGEHYMSWIHIDDMVRGIIHLLSNNNSHGPYNLTAPHPVKNKDFAKALAHNLGRPCISSTPMFVLKIMMGEMADLLIHGQNVIPEKLEHEGFHFEHTYINGALRSLHL